MFEKSFRIPAYWPALILSFFFTFLFGWFYFHIDENENSKLASLVAGFASAFLIATFQLIINVSDTLKLSKYVKTGFKEILSSRKDPKYYGKIIGDASNEILLIGVTASRFMDDFADSESADSAVPVLIQALNKHVKIKILLPKLEWLDAKKHPDFINKTLPRYQELQKTFSTLIEMKYYNHIPTHSIVATDKIAIVGPIFPNRESKNTQSLVLTSDSEYANQYREHFHNEWSAASEKYE